MTGAPRGNAPSLSVALRSETMSLVRCNPGASVSSSRVRGPAGSLAPDNVYEISSPSAWPLTAWVGEIVTLSLGAFTSTPEAPNAIDPDANPMHSTTQKTLLVVHARK